MNKEKVLDVARSNPGMSRRALAISAGVGYQTITKMVDEGQLILDAGGRIEAANTPEKELDLDIFGAESRGRLSKWGDRKVISVRSTIATLTKSAFEAMGVNLNAGGRWFPLQLLEK